MGKEQEIVINDGDDSQESEDEQIQRKDRIREVLDERDFITPLKEEEDVTLEASGEKYTTDSEQQAEQEIELSFDEIDAPPDGDQDDAAMETEVEGDDMLIDAEPDDLPNDLLDAAPEEPHDSANTGTDPDGDTDIESEPAVEDNSEIAAEVDPVDPPQDAQEPEASPVKGSAAKDPASNEKEKTPVAGEDMENNFLGLDEEEVDIAPAEGKKNKPRSASTKKPAVAGAKTATSKSAQTEDQPVKSKKKTPAPKASAKAAQPDAASRPSVTNKIVGYALVILVIAGFIFYNNPALIGLKKVSEPTAPQTALPTPSAPAQPVHPAADQTAEVLTPPSQHDDLTTRLEQAADLRDQLLTKREEINKLDAYYRNGIAELEQSIQQEAGQAAIASFDQALKNKRIELALRTIQRRQAYIQELEKPALWIDRGSEELLYLTRKAKLDLELIDIAGGIDLNKHKRHIRAAVHQYQPTADKLAVHLPEEKLIPLETIWQEASNKKKANTPIEKMARNTNDEQIASEICSGSLGRTAELTRISVDTAKCLARLNGSEMFLNSVPQLLPEAARELFRWQGKWICLNGVKALSPEVARYLFKWKGNWISLNGLSEFPPELAQDLLKWEGQQLELMGLKYRQTESEQKTLKYLALWETTGGKLFVPDEIRKEMNRIMVSQLQ